MKNEANLHDIDLKEISGGSIEYGPDGAKFNDSALIIAPKSDIINTFDAKHGIDEIGKNFTLSRDIQGKKGNFERTPKSKKFKIKKSR